MKRQDIPMKATTTMMMTNLKRKELQAKSKKHSAAQYATVNAVKLL